MERGRNELVDGDAAAAVASFERGHLLFQRGADGAGGPLLDAVSSPSLVARPMRYAPSPGPASRRPRRHGSSLRRWRTPRAAWRDSPRRTEDSPWIGPPPSRRPRRSGRLDGGRRLPARQGPSDVAPRPFASARRDAESELAELRDKVHAASLLLHGLPRFLGAEGPRRYFVGPQNPAELRGTGGLIGAYSILTIDKGHLHFEPFEPIQSLRTPVGEVPAPNDDYATNYEPFRGGDRFWTAINVMSDFPSVAQAILSSYEASTRERLDGVNLVDPFALAALLRATGPVELPGYGLRIDAHNVVPFTTNEAYSVLTDPEARKRVLGDVARAAFGQFIAQPSPDLADLELLLQASSTGTSSSIRATRPCRRGWRRHRSPARSPTGADGDLLSVVVNSAAGSKVEFYQERDIRHTVILREDGRPPRPSISTLEIMRRHRAAHVYPRTLPPKEGGRAGWADPQLAERRRERRVDQPLLRQRSRPRGRADGWSRHPKWRRGPNWGCATSRSISRSRWGRRIGPFRLERAQRLGGEQLRRHLPPHVRESRF